MESNGLLFSNHTFYCLKLWYQQELGFVQKPFSLNLEIANPSNLTEKPVWEKTDLQTALLYRIT